MMTSNKTVKALESSMYHKPIGQGESSYVMKDMFQLQQWQLQCIKKITFLQQGIVRADRLKSSMSKRPL